MSNYFNDNSNFDSDTSYYVSKFKIPPLMNLTKKEAQSIISMFRIYDRKLKGKITINHAKNLLRTLGISGDDLPLPTEMTLNEFLFIIDQVIPPPEPLLISSLTSFGGLASTTYSKAKQYVDEQTDKKNRSNVQNDQLNESKDPNNQTKSNAHSNKEKPKEPNDESALGAFYDEDPISGPVLLPKSILDFMESIGRVAPPSSEAELLLNSMLDYDDCSDIPIVSLDRFKQDIINYVKKNNALKDFK